jgi:four helix bundle protein
MTQELVKSYRDLLVWQRGIDLVEVIYRASARWPASEAFGLTGQIRRAAVSIPANIAEGHGRGGDKELARFLAISRGSHCEVETHLIIASRLQFLSETEFNQIQSISHEVGRLLHGLSKRLRADIEKNGTST